MQHITVLYFAIFVLLFSISRKSKGQQTVKPKAITKADSTEKLLFYTYGLPGPYESEMATSAVAVKWGFGYKCVAGYLVDQKLMDCVNKHRDIASTALIKKYGIRLGKAL